jgi:hypothetical protein
MTRQNRTVASEMVDGDDKGALCAIPTPPGGLPSQSTFKLLSSRVDDEVSPQTGAELSRDLEVF